MMTIKQKLGEAHYENLLASALLHTSHSQRIQHVTEKLQHNEVLRFVTLGGSITEGLIANKKVAMPYGNLIYDFLSQKLYGPRQVEYLNLGISCSFALLGLILTESHIRDFAPDLVIIDFSVNETLDQGGMIRFESLIRSLLNLPSQPALIILTLKDQASHTAAPYMTHMGKYYDLPVINLGDALETYFNAQMLCWSDCYADYIHPHQLGHQLIADCICYYFKQISMQKSNIKKFLPPCCFFAPYENMHFLSAKALYKISDTNFTLRENPDFIFSNLLCNDLSHLEHYLYFSLSCKILVFLFFQTNDVNFATATIHIDKVHTHFLQGYCQFVWQFPRPMCVLEENTPKPHQFELYINGLDSHKKFYLLGVGWC